MSKHGLESYLVGFVEIAQMLAGAGNVPLSHAEVDELVAQGMPAPEFGQYEANDCVFWWIGHLKAEARTLGVRLPEDDPVSRCRHRRRSVNHDD